MLFRNKWQPILSEYCYWYVYAEVTKHPGIVHYETNADKSKLVFTGDYTDISGGQGNVETGAYTSANAVQASSTTKSSSATATGTGLSATTMTATLATASTSATPTSVASATGGSSVEKIHVNAVGVVGAMGLIIGLVL